MKRFFDKDITVNCKSRWNVGRLWLNRNSGGMLDWFFYNNKHPIESNCVKKWYHLQIAICYGSKLPSYMRLSFHNIASLSKIPEGSRGHEKPHSTSKHVYERIFWEFQIEVLIEIVFAPLIWLIRPLIWLVSTFHRHTLMKFVPVINSMWPFGWKEYSFDFSPVALKSMGVQINWSLYRNVLRYKWMEFILDVFRY